MHGERGGAPLHFLLAWLVDARSAAGSSRCASFSALFAVASIPVVALLVAPAGGRRAAALAACSWSARAGCCSSTAIYARMYSLFLFTSALSYLALRGRPSAAAAGAGRSGGSRRVVDVASHPYGALVLGSQGL